MINQANPTRTRTEKKYDDTYGFRSCSVRRPNPFFSVGNTSTLAYWRFWKRLLVHRSTSWQREPLEKKTKSTVTFIRWSKDSRRGRQTLFDGLLQSFQTR